MKLAVDPWHWLDKDGHLPLAPARLRRLALRVARIIEYGGPLAPGHTLETLIECSRQPKRKPCPGLLWVEKLDDNSIAAFCVVCKDEEICVHNWEETEWADGVMDPVPVPVILGPDTKTTN
jgi:hypothetical protein